MESPYLPTPTRRIELIDLVLTLDSVSQRLLTVSTDGGLLTKRERQLLVCLQQRYHSGYEQCERIIRK